MLPEQSSVTGTATAATGAANDPLSAKKCARPTKRRRFKLSHWLSLQDNFRELFEAGPTIARLTVSVASVASERLGGADWFWPGHIFGGYTGVASNLTTSVVRNCSGIVRGTWGGSSDRIAAGPG